jgi:hypothetical protein
MYACVYAYLYACEYEYMYVCMSVCVVCMSMCVVCGIKKNRERDGSEDTSWSLRLSHIIARNPHPTSSPKQQHIPSVV